MKKASTYRGNKSVKGLYQFIINRIPPCKTFIEAFAGSAQITKKLFIAADTDRINCSSCHPENIVLNDCNRSLNFDFTKHLPVPTVISNYPAAQLLKSLVTANADTFIYCDPPYLKSTRGSYRNIYKHEMTVDDHREFLLLVRKGSFNCMISHYECDLYNDLLPYWNKEFYKVCYHGHVKNECIYYNYEKPSTLLSYRYVGSDCWDRQRIARKINRFVKKLNSLPELERNTILARLHKPFNY
jgi:site-specific DNA-adenine methylase